MEILHVQHWQMYLQSSQQNHHTNPWEYIQAQSYNSNFKNQKKRDSVVTMTASVDKEDIASHIQVALI